MSNLDNLNKEIFELACAVHGLEMGDTKALATYEMIKNFIVMHDFAVPISESEL